MKKHHIIAALLGAGIGYYLATQPNDGTGLTGIGGTIYGTIPTTLGLGTSPTVYALEGALFGWGIAKLIKR